MSLRERPSHLLVLTGVLVTLLISSFGELLARDTEKHRVVWRDNPSTSAVIAWVQTSGSSPMVHFGPVDQGTNSAAYPNSQAPDRIETHFSMEHHFVRLTGLEPDTPYYYVIVDSNGNSNRYWFRTAPDKPSAFNFIVGGDSRNFRDARWRANRMVAKLRPMFVMFDGDMTNENSDLKWDLWLDDWELTIGSDGRMTPIIPARGNHELSNDDIYKVFDVNNPEVYYANTIGGDQLRVYTLNTEINPGGDQQAWLENDLAANDTVAFKVVQYHRSTKPHTSRKGDRNGQYNAWANAFFDNKVDLVVEGDAHMVFRTWPLEPSFSGEDGFIRNDTEGTTYAGSGTWGAPLRANDDDKEWTRDSGSFNQFKLVTVDSLGIQVRTIMYDNVDLISEVSDSDPFETPDYLKHWSPENGAIIEIGDPYTSFNLAPAVNLDPSLNDPIYFKVGDTVSLSGSVVVEGSISSVNYFMDGSLISSCSPSAPDFSCSWMPPMGDHNVYMEVVDSNGLPGRSAPIFVTSQNQLPTVAVTSPSNGSAFEFGTQLMITASASDVDGSIAKVEFFQNGQFISGCQDTSAPYSCNWTPSQPGSYEIKASTRDDEGGDGVSGKITIQINEPPNSAPSITLTAPQDGATIQIGVPVTLTADASDSDGSVSKVEFFSSGSIISGCSDTSAPYQCSWTLSEEGMFSWSARVTDDDGVSTSSSSRSITVQANNQAPSISIVSPQDGTNYTEGDQVTIVADASDPDGSITEILFFENTNFISGCSFNSPPFECSFSPTAGNYQLQARAQDDGGLKTLSSQIDITVNSAANQAPNITIASPSDGASFSEGSSISLSATASDPDGNIAEVLFFQNDAFIPGCARQSPPFECSWTPPPGSYQLKARAQDDDGARTNSSIVTITVNETQNQVPSVSISEPIEGAIFEEGTQVAIRASASDGDGNIVNVSFLDNDQIIPNCDLSTPPYECLWTGSVGAHSLKARAKDNDGAITDTQVNVTVSESQNQAPTVSLSEPSNGQNFLAGNSILIKVQADDSDGTVAKVVFFSNNTALSACTDTEAPFECSISPDAGTYQLKARAEDDDGAQTFSESISISVNSPQNQAPSVTLTSPSDGSTFEQGSQVFLTADASDPDGTITEVDFEVNGQQIPSCIDTEAPYTCLWQPSEGTYSISAKAIDDDGLSSSSPAVLITIFIVNQAPSVSITDPSNGMNIPSGSDIIINADAQDQDGTIARVEFFANGSFINQCQDTEFPFNCVWSPSPGNYELQATAFDDDGSNSVSASVSVTVFQQQNQAPQVSIVNPTPNQEFEEGTTVKIVADANDNDGSIATVTFFEDGQEIPSCTDSTSPFECDWQIEVLGSHELTALAEDNEGATSLSSIVPVSIFAGLRAQISTEDHGGYVPYSFSATADGSIAPNGIDTYEWLINGSVVSTEASFDNTFQDPGLYGLELHIIDANGRVSQSRKHIVVSRSIGQNVVSLRQDSLGYQGASDNYIFADQPETNFGRSEGLSVLASPAKVSLMRWDLRGLPADAKIDSAALVFNITDASVNTIFLRVLNRDFHERESNWISAELGRNWELAGAQGESDRNSSSVLSFQAFNEGKLSLPIPRDQLSAIKNWIVDDVDNHGFGLYSESGNDQLGLSSSKNVDQSLRPALMVYYTLFGVDTSDDEVPLDEALYLSPAYPNPWNGISTIEIGTSEPADVELDLFDLNGRVVANLYRGKLSPNRKKQITLNASGLPGGVYIIQFSNGSIRKTRTITLVH